MNCEPSEIIFTSGGTESNNYAIKGVAFACRNKGNHIITTRIEHPAVLEVGRFLERQGFKITYLPVDEYGLIKVGDVEKAITPQTILVTVMQANNEVGTIQPIAEIAGITGPRGIIFHTDAAQAVGKIPADIRELGADLLSMAGHKLYAPKGVGVLYVRKGVTLQKFIHGAGQEAGHRAGTENILEIVGLGQACEVARRDLRKNISHLKKMRDILRDGLQKALSGRVRFNGHPQKCLPNTLSVSFKDVEAEQLISRIKDRLAVSAGAACHADCTKISYVLEAMKIPPQWAKGTIRFSTGRMTTPDEIIQAVSVITKAVSKK